MSDLYYQDVQIARIGTPLDIITNKGQTVTHYEIRRVTLEVTESDIKYGSDIITQMWTLATTDDEGEELDMPYITVNPDQIDYKFV